MAVKPVWSVVREVLSADLSLTADQVIAQAKAKGVKAPDADIRETVYNVRKKLKKKAARPAAAAAAKPAPAPAPAPTVAQTPKPATPIKPGPKVKAAPVAARRTAGPTTSAVVRSILSGDLNLTADEVVAKAKARGVTASESSIRALVYNIRGELKKKGGPAPKAVPSAAQETTRPAPASVAPAAPAPAGLDQVLSNVALVNAAVAASGGVEQARKVAEAVRACGGPEAFAQYLDLVAGIRTA